MEGKSKPNVNGKVASGVTFTIGSIFVRTFRDPAEGAVWTTPRKACYQPPYVFTTFCFIRVRHFANLVWGHSRSRTNTLHAMYQTPNHIVKEVQIWNDFNFLFLPFVSLPGAIIFSNSPLVFTNLLNFVQSGTVVWHLSQLQTSVVSKHHIFLHSI